MLLGVIKILGGGERIYKVQRTGVSGGYRVKSRRCAVGFQFRA